MHLELCIALAPVSPLGRSRLLEDIVLAAVGLRLPFPFEPAFLDFEFLFMVPRNVAMGIVVILTVVFFLFIVVVFEVMTLIHFLMFLLNAITIDSDGL